MFNVALYFRVWMHCNLLHCIGSYLGCFQSPAITDNTVTDILILGALLSLWVTVAKEEIFRIVIVWSESTF